MIVSDPTSLASVLIGALGDSQTEHMAGLGIRPSDRWHQQCARLATIRTGRAVQARAFGTSGDSTMQMFARADVLLMREVPNIGIVYGGVNDSAKLVVPASTQTGTGSVPSIQTLTPQVVTGAPLAGTFTVTFGANTTGQLAVAPLTAAQLSTALNALASVTSAGGVTVAGSTGGPWTVTFVTNGARATVSVDSSGMTTAYTQAIIKVLKHGATGPGAGLAGGCGVATENALPAAAKFGQRYVVMADGSSTGGVAPWRPGAAARVGGTVGGSGQSVWECAYPGLAGPAGWTRIAVDGTAPTVCQRIVVVSTNYLNWTTGGDTLTTPYAIYAPVRVATQAAVTAENVAVNSKPSVVHSDLYGFQKARIVAGTDPDFSSVAYDQTKSWHYTLNNQHHDTYGDALVSQCVDASIVTTGWYADIAAGS